MSTVSINAKLYSTLFNEGVEREIDSDKLIAVYCFIKSAKKGEDRIRPIKTENGRIIKNYRLLHKVTGLSEKTLRRYVPILESVGVFNFSKDGSAYIKGNRKTANEYKSNKTIRLEAGNSLSEMCLNSYFVRVKTKEKRIISAIDKNNTRIKILSKMDTNSYLSYKEVKCAKKLIRKGITLEKLKHNLNNVILSNAGYYNLKREITGRKNGGLYWKNKLKSAGKIKTRRFSRLIRKCTKTEFLAHLEHELNRSKFSWFNDYMREELPSEFTTTDFPQKETTTKKKETVKPLEHLSFDVIAWWAGN